MDSKTEILTSAPNCMRKAIDSIMVRKPFRSLLNDSLLIHVFSSLLDCDCCSFSVVSVSVSESDPFELRTGIYEQSTFFSSYPQINTPRTAQHPIGKQKQPFSIRIVSEGGSLQATPNTNPQSAHTSTMDVISPYTKNTII